MLARKLTDGRYMLVRPKKGNKGRGTLGQGWEAYALAGLAYLGEMAWDELTADEQKKTNQAAVNKTQAAPPAPGKHGYNSQAWTAFGIRFPTPSNQPYTDSTGYPGGPPLPAADAKKWREAQRKLLMTAIEAAHRASDSGRNADALDHIVRVFNLLEVSHPAWKMETDPRFTGWLRTTRNSLDRDWKKFKKRLASLGANSTPPKLAAHLQTGVLVTQNQVSAADQASAGPLVNLTLKVPKNRGLMIGLGVAAAALATGTAWWVWGRKKR